MSKRKFYKSPFPVKIPNRTERGWRRKFDTDGEGEAPTVESWVHRRGRNWVGGGKGGKSRRGRRERRFK